MFDLHRYCGTGHVGYDPKLIEAPHNFAVFSFSVKSGTKTNPRTDWLEVSCNGKTMEIVMQYIKKGMKLYIEGTPAAKAYVNKEGKAVATQAIYLNKIVFISAKKEVTDKEIEAINSIAEEGDNYAEPLSIEDIPAYNPVNGSAY